MDEALGDAEGVVEAARIDAEVGGGLVLREALGLSVARDRKGYEAPITRRTKSNLVSAVEEDGSKG